MKCYAYIDIETTGLSRSRSDLTVIGVALEKGRKCSVRQLVGTQISAEELLQILDGADEIYSYNGSRFDLPFINVKLGIDLKKCFRHTDLMYDCWRKNLKGGLKVVERKLGIDRGLKGVDGYTAVLLWWEYVNNDDREALETLLEYNREDVINLQTLREKLGVK
jgi:uncharacterized protein YprB with RNaseH-like and TPR domain